MSRNKLNQCQDCGCTGSKLIIEEYDNGFNAVKCPYCGRKGALYKPPVSARGSGKVLLSMIVHFKLMTNSWNSFNREYKEGLA